MVKFDLAYIDCQVEAAPCLCLLQAWLCTMFGRVRIMNDTEFVERLAEALAGYVRPTIPLSIDLWDIGMIANYLKRDPQVVRERMACLPGFPKAIRLPTKTGRAQPLYSAKEVIEWVHSHKEKN